MAERFKDARMTQSTPASSIDSHTQDLEDAIVAFLGVPVNEDLTGPLFDTDIDGNIIDFFRSAAAPNVAGNSGPGWRLRDTTNDSEMLITIYDGKLRFYENTGSQSSPTWAYRNEMDVVTGNWAKGSDYSSALGVKDIYGSVDFSVATGAFVQWDSLDWMVDGVTLGLEWTSGYRSRLICKDPGDYIFTFNVYYHPGAPAVSDVQIFGYLAVNGVLDAINGMKFATPLKSIDGVSEPGLSLEGSAGTNLDLDDYVELRIQTAGGTGYDGSLVAGGILGHMVGRT